jgi:cytochrome c-type biogenesis protein CcmE
MTGAIKPKHQRLVLLTVAMVAIIGAGLLAAFALREQASYFYLPSEIEAQSPETGRAMRLGGLVEMGSIETQADGVTIHFVVGDGEASVPVSFTGIAPALFVEGSGVIAEGAMEDDGTFVATNLLAKHDEKYVPRELEGMNASEVRAQIEATLE